MTGTDLDDLFASARARAPEASPAFLGRVLEDAYALQPEAATAAPAPAAAPAPVGIWARLAAALGGSMALAGVATAGVAGVWLGFAPPATLSPLADSLLTGGATASVGVDLLPGLDPAWGEEG